MIWVALIGALPAIIAALVGMRSHGKINELRLQINGRVDELIKAAREAGNLQGQAEEQQRRSTRVKK